MSESWSCGNASELLRRVEQGESIEITDRGRPVAVLAPLPVDPLERLIAAGDLQPSDCDIAELPEPSLVPAGAELVPAGAELVLRRIPLLRINSRVLGEAGQMTQPELRSLHAIHLASARLLGAALKLIVTYDERMTDAAKAGGWTVSSPR